MKNNKSIIQFIFALFLLVAATQSTYAQQIIVGTGTSTSTYTPARYYNGYGWSQSIYKSSEINKAGTITKIAYQVQNSPNITYNNQKIYLYETTANTVVTGYTDPANMGATLVYSGSISYVNGWVEITFQTPFNYSGTKNLMVALENRNGYYSSGYPNFQTSYTGSNAVKYYYYSSSTSAFGGYSYTSQYRPNIRFNFLPVPNDLAVEQWFYPQQGASATALMPIMIKIKNLGTVAQSGYTVKYSIDNGLNWKSQLVSTSLASNTSTTINFFGGLSADMSTAGLYQCIGVVRSTGDTVTYNDTIRQNITICNGAYSGTYTIGTDTASDFPSIESAVSSLNSCGASGPVTYRIKTGVYNKQVRISPITGVSASTPITFESFSGNPNDVVYQHAATTSADNYVLRLDTASYITFKNITFKALGTTYSKVVNMFSSHHCNLESNRLISHQTTTNTVNQAVLHINDLYTNNIIIDNNVIEKGSYGILAVGNISLKTHSISIINNRITGYYINGVNLQYIDSFIVNNNYIKSTINYYTFTATSCYGAKEIQGNTLIGITQTQMYLVNTSGTSSAPLSIANNFIYQSVQSAHSVYLLSCNYVNFDFNSIHTKGSYNYSANLYVSSGSNINLRNNNFVNRAGGYTLYTNTPTVIANSDYNNLYTTGSYLGYWNGARTNLAALKTASSKDVHSVSNNVLFFADDNLHVSGTSLNNLGTPIAGITVDFDGQTRSATTPDIGADEYNLDINDAGLLSFENMQSLCPGSSSNITVKLSNYGLAGLTSAKIGWSVNGNPQPDTTFSTAIWPNANANVVIGSYTFSSDSSYTIIAWIDSINNTTDQNIYNDTVVLSNFHVSLAGGTYQIGSSASADFSDVNTAISAVNQYGICGPIVFNIENGTYSGQYNIGNVNGLSATNTIMFKSLTGNASDVTLLFNSISSNDAYIFKLDNATNISFKNLTFKSTSTYYTRLIWITNTSHQIEIDSCVFQGISVTNTSDYNSLVHIYNSNQVTVKNSSFNEGAYAFYCRGINSSTNITGIKILNNTINNFYRNGVYLNYVGDSLEVIGNTIKDKLSTSGSTAIYKAYGSGKATISNNKIDLISPYVNQGLYVYRHNYYNNNSTNILTIKNNFILINTSSTITTRGIYNYYSRNTDIFYNTIKIISGSTNSYALYLYYSNFNNIKNNIFDVGLQNIYYIRSSSITSSDYNNFYSDNTSPMYYSYSSRTIANYKSYSGFDSHSKNVDPNYISSSDLHLHDITLNNAGTPISGITTDIDGDTRHATTPDIGADEFVMLANDAELFAINRPTDITSTGSTQFKVSIRNMGTTNLVMDSIHYKLDANSIVSVQWTGNLAPLAVDSFILIGTETLSAGNHNLKTWSTSPNNVNDLNKNNDTLQKSFMVQVMPSIVIEPMILTATITNCGDSVLVPLKIKNTGGATLTGYIDSTINSGSGNQNLEVLMLTYGTNSTYSTNMANALDETFSDYTLTNSLASSTAQLAIDLAGKDVVIMPYMSSSSYYSTYATFTSILQNFVSSGGTMIFAGQNYRSYIDNTGLWTGGTYVSYSNSSNVLTIMSHPITTGLTSTNLGSLNEYYFYYNGHPTNYTSLLKNSSYEVAGLRTYGAGMVIFLGYRYTNSNQTAAAILASNALKYVSDQRTNWLSSTSLAISILANDSAIYNIKMNSAGLLNGTYTSSFDIHTNDLGNPIVNVPCTMIVAGSPIVNTVSNSVNFGGTYLNIASYDSLAVYNTGCGDLLITNVNSSNSAFTAVNAIDTVAPGDTTYIVYKFLTASAGAYAATSVIFNNDTNYTVSLAANATNPPTATFTPNPMNITVTNCNDSITTNLQIQNTGGGTLTATIETAKDSVEIIILTYGAYSSYLNVLKSSLNYTFSKFNYTELYTVNATVLQNQIASQDADIIIIPYLNGSSYASSYSSLATTLQNFVNGGGTVIYTGHYYDNIFSATGLISGVRNGGTSYATLTTQNVNDPITLNFASTYSCGTDDFYYYTFSGSNITSLVKYNSYDMAVRKQYGAGNVIVIGQIYNSTYINNTKAIISNSIKYVWENGADWLQYTTSTANLSSGTSALKPIKFNANGLASGTYTSQIKITTNSPTNPIVYVPCTLTVLNQMVNGVSLGNDTTNCGALTLNAGSFTNYAWNTGNTTQTISAVSTGTYSVTVTNGGNCTSSDTIAVTINPIPSVSLTGLPTSSCTNSAAVSLNASPTGGVFAGPGITNNTFYPATAGAGTHTLFYSYTNIYNCTNTASQQITVNNPPIVSFSGLNTSYCPQGTPSVLLGIPSGGTFTGTGMNSNTFVPAVAGPGNHNIVYSYTDANNCSNSDTNSTLVNTPTITISISGLSTDQCIDNAVSVLSATPSGGIFTGAGVSGTTFNPSVAGVGTHYVKYTKQDANSCMVSDSVAVIVHALPSGLNISGLGQSFCANETPITLTGVPAGGVFTGQGISGSSFYPTQTGAGQFTITYTYTDVFGCSNFTTALAEVDPLPSITFTNLQSSYCEDDVAITITATPSGGTLSGDDISNGQFDPISTGAGSYYVYYEYTDANMCYNKDSFNIIVNSLPSVNMGSLPQNFCSNGVAVSLTATPLGGVFSGTGVSGTSFNPAISGAGLYSILYSYTDNNGCSNSDSASTTVIQVHGVDAGNDTTITYNSTVQLAGIVLAGTGPFSYSWTPSNLLTNSAVLSPTTNTMNATTEFTLSVVDNGTNCTNSDKVMVNITGGPLTATSSASPAAICAGESSQLQVLGTGGSGIFTYNWTSSPSGFTSTISNPIVSPSQTTIYTCILDDGTDTVHKNVTIIVNPLPAVSISNLNSSYCNNEDVVNVIVSPPGGSLSGGGINGLTFNPSMASLGQNTVVYSMTNSNNCYGADTMIIDVYNAPSAYAGSDTTLACLNGGMPLGQQPVTGVNYLWSPNIGLSSNTIANPYANPNLTISYTLEATDNVNACISRDTVNITVIGAPTAVASNDTLVCPNTQVTLIATGGDTYLWSDGSTGNSLSVSPLKTTLYYVIVTQAGCADLDTVYVNISDPKPMLGPDTTLCGSQSITLNAGAGFTSYLWSNAANTQTISVDSAGIGYNAQTYSVEVIDTLSCIGNDTITLSFVNCTGLNDVDENLFTINIYPNPSDGKFIIESNNTAVQKVEMRITDAQGKLILSKSLNNSSGRFKEVVDLSTESKGVYFIKLSNNGIEKVFKVLIQ